ncbi:aminoglycoside phosphotransferase family protein [Chitinimonas sp. BJYL2]|uniref:aminoglycoside phosphotransferase family protein n=1 Tax=Chitinimonas sp. BJYL2 TaxID=2976696 RepID=UPI0022B5DE84|nr:phosphotransferase [Chitinimonas sp. BJYL2]
MDRYASLQTWLHHTVGDGLSLSEPIGDASGRRYFRVTLPDGRRHMLMDAPPERVDCGPFLGMAERLRPQVRVPAVVAFDAAAGFLLLDDLGLADMQTALAGMDEAAAGRLYLAALDTLIALQQTPLDGVPDYGAEQMVDDLNRFAEWYADKHLGKPLQGDDLAVWERSRSLLVARAQAQPKVLIHFDYHSRNLMVADGGSEDARIGVLDFQDARVGPLGYDLASLLKDMYVQWPEDFRLDLAIRYWEKARKTGLPVAASFDQFYLDFEVMGVFRQVRTLGTFARLAHRDGKPRYIDDMPVALAYLRETCMRYAELHPLYKLLNKLTGFQVTTGYTF